MKFKEEYTHKWKLEKFPKEEKNKVILTPDSYAIGILIENLIGTLEKWRINNKG